MAEKKKKITTEDLARMVQGGFSDMKENFEKEIGEVKKDIGVMKTDIHNLKVGQNQILKKLEGVDLSAMPAKK